VKPRTVDVPEPLQGLFAEAEALVEGYFRQKRERPEEGTIEIAGERYVLLRAASLSVRFFQIVRELYGEGREREADELSRNILFDLAHGVGRSDAEAFAARTGQADPIERLSAGPVHFAFTGWAKVHIDPESQPSPDDDFYLLYDHPYSFESDAWAREGLASEFPVCIMNAGYSSGWCEASFGLRLVATEICCRARGDAYCRFVMAPPERIEAHVGRYFDAQPPTVARGPFQIPDLFARKAVEERLREAQRDLEGRVRARTRELQEANAALREEMARRERVERELRQSQKMEAIGRLAGGIAHDFNNLLGVILGCSSMLEERMPDEQSVQVIRQASERAAELTKQLLAFSRSQIARAQPVSLAAVVKECDQLLTRLIGEHIQLRTVVEDSPLVHASETGLQQVLLNLAVNARDAMPEGGTLTLRVGAIDDADGSWGLLTVADTGHGMRAEVADRIFDPFFTTKERGSGLGLSTAHGIVHQYGGAIRVHSTPGEGTRFDVLLPEFEDDEVTQPHHLRITPAPGRAGTILVVEDDVSLRGIIGEMLESGGHTVWSAGGPLEALALLEQGIDGLDLLLTDVVMPEMNGRALADEVLRRLPDVAVLFISGYADDDVLRKGHQAASYSCLHKPFTPKQLLDAVRAALSPPGSQTE